MNKKIVITGATKGIGRAIAEKFAMEGFDLALCGRNEADLRDLTGKLKSPKNRLIVQKCDVTNKGELQNFAEKIVQVFGVADILVNNAGIYLPGKLMDEEDGTLEKLMDTNLYSAYHLSRLLLPGMMKKRAGQIFNICSVASIQAYPTGGSYSISKFAMLGLSKALREELKEFNIKVTALLPGATHTDSWNGVDIPRSRFMLPEDLAKIVWDIYNLSEQTVVEEILLRPVLGDL